MNFAIYKDIGTFLARVLELRFKGMDQLQDPPESNTGEIVS